MQKTILHFSHNFLSCYPENITAPCEIFGRNKGAIASRLKELNDNNKVIVYGDTFVISSRIYYSHIKSNHKKY